MRDGDSLEVNFAEGVVKLNGKLYLGTPAARGEAEHHSKRRPPAGCEAGVGGETIKSPHGITQKITELRRPKYANGEKHNELDRPIPVSRYGVRAKSDSRVCSKSELNTEGHYE